MEDADILVLSQQPVLNNVFELQVITVSNLPIKGVLTTNCSHSAKVICLSPSLQEQISHQHANKSCCATLGCDRAEILLQFLLQAGAQFYQCTL